MPILFIHWITQYGPPALFSLLMLGIIGLPVPDETLLTFAGVLVSQGKLPFVPTLVAANLGSMVGITVSYALGRTTGLALVHRYGRWIHLTDERLHQVNLWLSHKGRWSLTFGYFLPGVRHITGIVAGSSELPFANFSLFAYLGACVWSSSFVLVGWYVGDEWQAVLGRIRQHILTAVAILVGLGIAYLLVQRRRSR
jgi:membrane protein DedA with SNARE-associated domain